MVRGVTLGSIGTQVIGALAYDAVGEPSILHLGQGTDSVAKGVEGRQALDLKPIQPTPSPSLGRGACFRLPTASLDSPPQGGVGGGLGVGLPYLCHQQMLTFEVTSGTAEILVVGGDGDLIDKEKAEDGDEDYLGKDPTVLTAVGPEALAYHFF